MNEASPAFLHDKVATHGVVRLHVLAAPAPQTLRAELAHVYRETPGLQGLAPGSQIEFVSSPGHWGSAVLRPGDDAVVFLRRIAGKLYQDPWRGHLFVEDIDGVPHAVFQHRELWLSEDLPAALRAAARQDPRRAYASAIRLDAFETYLRSLIQRRDRVEPATP
jgi:hypothetical protein